LAVHHTNLIRPRASPFFLFTPPAPTEIYTLSLHDALPIFDDLLLTRVERMAGRAHLDVQVVRERRARLDDVAAAARDRDLPVLRSEEHTSELQSRENLVCRLLLEKKK